MIKIIETNKVTGDTDEFICLAFDDVGNKIRKRVEFLERWKDKSKDYEWLVTVE